ncbi:hypothetical protein J2X20_005459 [Pelomonas saccharophila]|uniref:Ice-binding protein C-terminal domain-containing protein n=1 Tax=Roseateles saccharophilus TaxID=304 RepID=A0ABU1YV83_ROSSA|nr:PEP-CTERM sorting domain-containing protein [Roseateles saccharophilus]MDR7272776.1 hypothetical protein [Roseateles saccharophilus]
MFKPLTLAAALLIGTPAFAVSTVSVRFVSRDASAPVLNTSMTSNYITGGLNFTDAATGSFLAYCVEPSQSFALSFKSDGVTPNFKTYTVDSFSASQASLLQGLYSSSFASVHSGNQQAAFQLAVWEIMRESSGTLSIAEGNGNFFLKTAGATGQQNGINNSVQALASHYLSAAESYNGPGLYSLTKLSNATYQDLVVASAVNAVPEPETYALFLAGLGAIGLMARRRLPR